MSIPHHPLQVCSLPGDSPGYTIVDLRAKPITYQDTRLAFTNGVAPRLSLPLDANGGRPVAGTNGSAPALISGAHNASDLRVRLLRDKRAHTRQPPRTRVCGRCRHMGARMCGARRAVPFSASGAPRTHLPAANYALPAGSRRRLQAAARAAAQGGAR